MPQLKEIKDPVKALRIGAPIMVEVGQVYRDLDHRNTLLRRLRVEAIDGGKAICTVAHGPRGSFDNCETPVKISIKRLQQRAKYRLYIND